MVAEEVIPFTALLNCPSVKEDQERSNNAVLLLVKIKFQLLFRVTHLNLTQRLVLNVLEPSFVTREAG